MKLCLAIREKAGLWQTPLEFYNQPKAVQNADGVRWYIVCPTARDNAAARSVASSVPDSWRGISAEFDDGWDGSYHAPSYYPCADSWIVMGKGRRAGMLGRMRKLAHALEATAASPTEPSRSELNTPVSLVARGIWRQEGD